MVLHEIGIGIALLPEFIIQSELVKALPEYQEK